MVDYDIGVKIPDMKRGRKTDPNSASSIICGLPENGSYFFHGMKHRTVTGIATMMRRRGKIDFRICTRAVTENGVDGVRVWRLPNDSE